MQCRPLNQLVLLLIAILAAADVPAEYRDDPYATEFGLRSIDNINQWSLETIGLKAEMRRALTQDISRERIIVAVIDTGLDYEHRDLSIRSVWFNDNETRDVTDSDGNGYVDDVLGWDFIDNDNDPWDYVGHGTHVAGIIAANTGNGRGIAGIDSRARIMPLRAMNTIGRGPSSRVAEAIYYAVANGAQIINLSMAVKDVSELETKAINHALASGRLVVVAAGNEADDVTQYTPGSIPGVITVASTGRDDKRASFSNWGRTVDIAAPGNDILSLRAAHTDFMVLARPDETRPLEFAVGPATEYYRTDGTSFSAPMVSAVAALLWSRQPELSAKQVERVLLQSARDVETPGYDQYTGYGIVSVAAALDADPEFFIDSVIDGIAVAQTGGRTVVQVTGTADANLFKSARLDLGQGESPTAWQPVGRPLSSAIRRGLLSEFDANVLTTAPRWTLRLITEHASGRTREAWFLIDLG